MAPTLGESADMSNMYKTSDTSEESHTRHTAGVWGYIFQIIFQVFVFYMPQFFLMNLNLFGS